MKKKLLVLILIAVFGLFSAQIGINTKNPVATLDVTGFPNKIAVVDGIIAPRITGNKLKNKDDTYDFEQTGAIVYVTSAANPTTEKTKNVTAPGYYYFDGSVWISMKGINNSVSDATRFLGGTVYVKFAQQSGGALNSSSVINNGNSNYSIGGISQSSTQGGINSIIGSGYTISNPANGIFDIMFNTPLKNIYGISVNIIDAYGYNSGNQGMTPVGQDSDSTQPGMRLRTSDNAQVSFISNSIIRVKTGNELGTLSNRAFTFLVTGQ